MNTKPIVNASNGNLFLLGLIFLVLKLTGHITWSWWFVLMPFYIIPALLLSAAAVFVVIGLISKLFTERK